MRSEEESRPLLRLGGGWGTRGSSTGITWGSFDRGFTYLNFKNQKLRDGCPQIRRVRAKVMVAGGRGGSCDR